jgi:hypothetical protein
MDVSQSLFAYQKEAVLLSEKVLALYLVSKRQSRSKIDRRARASRGGAGCAGLLRAEAVRSSKPPPASLAGDAELEGSTPNVSATYASCWSSRSSNTANRLAVQTHV